VVSVVPLPAPVALARLVDYLTPSGAKDPVWEPKWDGYRALSSAGRLYSRNRTNLTPVFPDLAPVLAARLPADLVLDGELIAWDAAAGRLDFAGLQARMTAGRRIRAVVAQRPAQFVVFDVLAAGGEDLRGRPLRERRRILEQALSGLASPIVLCQQTVNVATAREWLDTLTAGGIEGLVVKDAAGTYPTREGQRVWWKVKARATLDMLAIGFTGSVAAPSALVLAFPGTVDEDGQPVTAGSTTVLNRAAARSIVPLLRPTGASFERAFVWGSSQPTTVTVIEPFVVEVEADASAGAGVLRHSARLHRARPDLDPTEAG
jgi:ATP-dependent DNA ligase